MNALTGVLEEAWTLYRRHAAHFLAIAFVIYLVTAVIVAVLTAFAGIGGEAGAAVINVIAVFLVQAALVKAVQDVRDGRVDLDFAETISAAVPLVLPVTIASILAAIGITAGLVLLIVPGLMLLTFWSLIVPSIAIGGAGAISAFGHSWRAVRGYAWNVFGTYVVVFLLWIAFGIVLGIILLAVPAVARNIVSSVVSGTLVAPFLALVVTLIYYRLTAAHQAPSAAGDGAGPYIPGAGVP